MTPQDTTIFHNPKCGTSRKVLDVLRDSGRDPHVIEYLKTPPTRAELTALLAKLGIGPRALLRKKEAAYAQLDLGNPGHSDDTLIDAILAHPILMERPIVVTPLGARVCRPPERLQDILG
jgi:arsenate reductase